VFDTPEYQQVHVSKYQAADKSHLAALSNKFNASGRGYPDLALQSRAYLVSLYQNVTVVHGTSAAAPLLASMIALINSERLKAGKSTVGFINPALYAHPDIFNDVITGSNEGCGADPAFRATKGWDPVTGLGSPDYERLKDLFMSLA
jgi:tripeptidyl-peptidase-1